MLKVLRVLTHLILPTPHKVDIIIVAICQNEETKAQEEVIYCCAACVLIYFKIFQSVMLVCILTLASPG